MCETKRMTKSDIFSTSRYKATYNNSVVPGKYGELIEPSNQIPARSDIAGNEDRKREDGEGVHESLPSAGASL